MSRKFGPRGGPPGSPKEKAKDFKGSIIRLFSELNKFKVLVIISLVLAMASATLSIIAPNKLSNMTDIISDGLVINKEKLELISSSIMQNISKDKINEAIYGVFASDFSYENIAACTKDESLSNEDKLKLAEAMSVQNTEKIYENIKGLPENVKNVLFKESTYDGVVFLPEEKIQILNLLGENVDISKADIPQKLVNVIFEDIYVDGVLITPDDQYKFAVVMASVSENPEDVSLIYENIEKLPESIYNMIKPKMDTQKIKNIAIFLLLLYLTSAIFSYIQSICMTDVSNKFARRLRQRISKKINLLELKYFDMHQSGDILSRVTNDVDNIAQSMNQSLATLVTSLTLFLGSIIMMFVTNAVMAIVAILSSLIGFAGMAIILRKSQKYFIAKQEELGNLNGHIEEIYSGLNVVKVYNGKKSSDEKFDKFNKKVCESNRKSQFLSGMMHPIMGFIGNFGYVAVCIVGALLAFNGNITFGVIVAFMVYVRLFTNPLSQIAQAMTSLQSTAASGERVFEFLDEDEMKDESSKKAKLDKEKVKGKIEFNNVVFQYSNNDHPTINNFTAIAKPGQKIAIVGPTGAGKTTLVNLLMKFYEINSGDIRIDDVSINDLTRENIHSLFTMVLQDTWLFEGTLRDNIIYNREGVSDERVEEVCKIVGLDHFVKTLPNGLDTIISENDSVSAGQKQLLTIARGMIEDSPFLILDEATSNVDTRTEELVQKAMDKLTEGRTSFIIAHRLSTIKNADLILVVKAGNIVEQGNHDELIKKNGFYAQLYNSQFEL